MLANRFKPLLLELMATKQSAFVGGKQIQDNIFVVWEVLHQIRNRKRRKEVSTTHEVRYEENIQSRRLELLGGMFD